jgi:diaminopimelate decarboxylase
MENIENVSILSLAKKFQTPFYCYSKKQIEDNFNEFKKGLSSLKNFEICYAVKANSNLSIINTLAKLKSGADTVSMGEIIRSLKAKIPAKKIVFSGVGKSEQEIKYAIKKGIMQFNVESTSELEIINSQARLLKKTANVAIRVNPNVDAKTHGKITTGRKCDKFGIDVDVFEDVLNEIKKHKNLNFVGISCHIGSQITSLKVYEDAFKVLVSLYKKHNFQVIDIGGGIGIRYKDEKAISIADYCKLVVKYFGNLDTKIIIEPGRRIVGNAGFLVSKVLLIKNTPEKNFAVIDAGMNDLIRPAMYDAFHKITKVSGKGEKNTYDIVGPICETSDTFLKDYEIETLKKDDVLVIENAGAYGSSMSSNYNSKPLISEILIDNKTYKVIRKKQTLKQMFSCETF